LQGEDEPDQHTGQQGENGHADRHGKGKEKSHGHHPMLAGFGDRIRFANPVRCRRLIS
jgi:hypothetical protein